MKSLLSSAATLLIAVPPLWAASITCPANLLVSAGGICGATVIYPAPIVSGTAFLSCDTPSGAIFPVGTNTVSCAALNPSPPPVVISCDFTVTVIDTQPPTIVCPSNVDVGSEPDACGATVTFAADASDQCIDVTTEQQYGLPSDSIFPVGTTLVGLMARDAAGNTASCGFQVKVTDTVAPQLTCPADIVVANPGPVEYDVVAADACDVADLSLSQPSGSVFRGARTVVGATARDGAGNSSSCTFAVIVEQPTTSTTLPPQAGCESASTFASIACRLTALAPVVSAAATEPARDRLSRLLDRADDFVRTAESLAGAGRKPATRAALRKAIARMRRFRKKVLAPKSGVSDPARTSMAEAAETLQEDLRTLLGS